MNAPYPRTIENGAGSSITFVRVGAGEHGDRLELEGRQQPGAGTPPHSHEVEQETVTVRSGRIGWTIADGPEQFGGPGDTVTFAAGVVHRFWNAGTEELVCDGVVTPPGDFERMLTGIYAAMRGADA